MKAFSHPSDAHRRSRRPASVAAFSAVAIPALLSPLWASWSAVSGLAERQPPTKNIFFVLFREFEPVAGLLLLLLLGFFGLWAVRRPVPQLEEWAQRLKRRHHTALWILAVGVAAFSCWGAHRIYHEFPFSMDEYGAHFQAQTFARAEWAAPLAETWRPYARAMTPIFVDLHRDPLQWTSHYLPIYGLMKVPFLWLGMPALLNALWAMIALFAVAAVAGRLWPRHAGAPLLAALLLASSSQFLVTSMSFYSMPAHLGLNLIWLYLFSRADTRSTLLLPWVGVAAMGLHQFVMHSIFAAPFLIQLALRRRFLKTAYVASVYLAGLAFWWWWLQLMRPDMINPGTVFAVPGAGGMLHQALNLSLIVNWQSAALSVAALVALAGWRSMSWTERNLALSFLATFAFYVFYVRNQGHGWGYRYIYPVLGNLALLAVLGCRRLADTWGPAPARTFLALSLLAVPTVQLPWRLVEVETTIRPFAEAYAELRSSEVPILVVDADSVWYGSDLIRNDPWLEETPRLLRLRRLKDPEIQRLQARDDVGFVSARSLAGGRLVQGTP